MSEMPKNEITVPITKNVQLMVDKVLQIFEGDNQEYINKVTGRDWIVSWININFSKCPKNMQDILLEECPEIKNIVKEIQNVLFRHPHLEDILKSIGIDNITKDDIRIKDIFVKNIIDKVTKNVTNKVTSVDLDINKETTLWASVGFSCSISVKEIGTRTLTYEIDDPTPIAIAEDAKKNKSDGTPYVNNDLDAGVHRNTGGDLAERNNDGWTFIRKQRIHEKKSDVEYKEDFEWYYTIPEYKERKQKIMEGDKKRHETIGKTEKGIIFLRAHKYWTGPCRYYSQEKEDKFTNEIFKD